MKTEPTIAGAIALLLASPLGLSEAAAQNSNETTLEAENSADERAAEPRLEQRQPQELAEDVKDATAGEWISLAGKVRSASADHLSLSYGPDAVRVELEEIESWPEDEVKAGDRVTVSGRVDNDFYEGKTVNAAAVHVASLDRTFHGASEDQRTYHDFLASQFAEDGDWVTLSGRIGKFLENGLTLETGIVDVNVDTDQIDEPINDDKGDVRLALNDRVLVTGRVEKSDLFDAKEIEAHAIVAMPDQPLIPPED